MKDYFNELSDARGRLAGANVIMKGYLEAIEKGNDRVAESWLSLMKEEVVEVQKLLDTRIGKAV